MPVGCSEKPRTLSSDRTLSTAFLCLWPEDTNLEKYFAEENLAFLIVALIRIVPESFGNSCRLIIQMGDNEIRRNLDAFD